MDVEVCADGAEGFRRLLEIFNELDLLIVDLEMPSIDGAEFLDRIRRVGGEADLRIVVLSGLSEEALARIDLKGANAVISKSVGLPLIIVRVKRVLGR